MQLRKRLPTFLPSLGLWAPRVGRAALLAAGVFTTACAGVQLGGTGGPGQWRRIETPHYSLHTDASKPQALELAQSLEDAYGVLTQVVWKGATEPPGRTEVVAFARPADYHRYGGPAQTSGAAFTQPQRRRLLAFSPGPESGLPETIVHEIIHDLSFWQTPLIPSWYAEGLASFLENLSYDRSKQVAVLGRPNQGMIKRLNAARFVMRAEKLFDAETAIHSNLLETGSFYASSWLLVHYLINQQNQPFSGFQAELHALYPWREAWKRQFPKLTVEQLNDELMAYAKRANFSVLEAEVHIEPIAVTPYDLTEGEKHGLLAWTAARMQGMEKARKELDLALQQPSPPLTARLAELALTQEAGERLRIAKQAVVESPEQGEAWTMLLECSEDPNERAHALQKARALAPWHPVALRGQAWADLEAGRIEQALERAEQLLRRSGPGLLNRTLYVRASALAGDCAAARDVALTANFGKHCQVDGHSCDDVLKSVYTEACKKAAGQVSQRVLNAKLRGH